ncbi:M20 aminoacylase family protein [Kushneria marisflavi]|uniref:Amidohydrolase n=1 Tax=Kushneria marisflavi TaxID=157779 RepID=A0A240USH1_9GAMM|nr:M20 aminoacylase family protein [Kushneria marisflavi]ART64055.1 amidohydrolase [Kushneria marisflavi]RKD85788.1 hippurate hydrolase [Kushneria marisflavi]
MAVMADIEAFSQEMTRIRQDLHAHPEIGFEEQRTAGIVADYLRQLDIEVHAGIGKTGVVGIVEGHQGPGRSIGLRADMDALPMEEETGLPFASRHAGRFHGCGHDGHTTMLMGAARHLAAHRDFAGRVVLIFQPAEEGLGGARAMLADGLFERFPCDEIYALHNAPHLDHGQVGILSGKAMAGAEFFDIHIRGCGSHGAQPNNARDPIVVATQLAQAMQSIVSRNTHPLDAAVLSITQIHSGAAYNVIPQSATLSGTIRSLDDEVASLVDRRIRELAAGLASAYGVEIEVDIRNIFSVLENYPEPTEFLARAARDIVGEKGVTRLPRPVMGSEDFADMLKVVPGAYCWVGHAGNVPVHNPAFTLDDGILPIGASLLARIAERRLTGDAV